MKESYLEKGCIQKEDEKKYKEVFQRISMIILLFSWIGCGHALYRGNSGNLSFYSTMIVLFSLLNADILFCIKNAKNKVVNALAKFCGIFFVIGAFAEMAALILK